MDRNKVDYIWKNYRHLIDKKTDYSRYMRAALFSINPNWADSGEIEELQARFSREELNEKIRVIDSSRDIHAKDAYETHKEEIFFNHCSECGALAIAPGSERCIACGHTWYGTNPHRKNS